MDLEPPSTTFHYEPLDISQDEIRLVRILPASSLEDPIACELRHVSLKCHPTYEALSYSWGSNQRDASITLNGQNFAVTESLQAALRRLRKTSELVDIWIDQICINQEDVTERSEQVLRMMNIFQSAEQVLVWLGESDATTATALAHFEELCEAWQRRESKTWTGRLLRFYAWLHDWATFLVTLTMSVLLMLCFLNDWMFYAWILYRIGILSRLVRIVFGFNTTSWRIPLQGWISGMVNLSYYLRLLNGTRAAWSHLAALADERSTPSEPVLAALKSFFDRQWFRRIWVVQEVVVARKVTVLCGEFTIPWETLSDAEEMIHQITLMSSRRSGYIDTEYEVVRSLASMIRHKPNDQPFTTHLQSLLCGLCLLNATIPHDKVYGLLGLAKEIQEHQESTQGVTLKPRYDKALPYVYAEVVKYLVTTTKRLDILRANTGRRSIPDLPTWVPDWTLPEPKEMTSSLKRHLVFDIPTRSESDPVAEFSDDLKTIKLTGFHIGYLDDIGEDEAIVGSDMSIQGASITMLAWARFLLIPFLWLFLSGILTKVGLAVCRLMAWVTRKDPSGSKFWTDIATTLQVAQRQYDEFVERDKKLGNPGTYPSILAISQQFPLAFGFARSCNTIREPRYTRQCAWSAVESLDIPSWMRNTRVATAAHEPRVDDLVCMFVGGNLPYLLRKSGGKTGNTFEVVGVGEIGMIEDMLWEQAVKRFQEGHLQLLEFTIC